MVSSHFFRQGLILIHGCQNFLSHRPKLLSQKCSRPPKINILKVVSQKLYRDFFLHAIILIKQIYILSVGREYANHCRSKTYRVLYVFLRKRKTLGLQVTLSSIIIKKNNLLFSAIETEFIGCSFFANAKFI